MIDNGQKKSEQKPTWVPKKNCYNRLLGPTITSFEQPPKMGLPSPPLESILMEPKSTNYHDSATLLIQQVKNYKEEEKLVSKAQLSSEIPKLDEVNSSNHDPSDQTMCRLETQANPIDVQKDNTHNQRPLSLNRKNHFQLSSHTNNSKPLLESNVLQ